MTRVLLRDSDIRRVLVAKLRRDDAEAAIFQELPLLRGEGRADVVSVNGVIAGYEIKSDRDSLARLASQTGQYASVCEYMTVVVTWRHLERARAMLPARWGICIADLDGTNVVLEAVRKPRRNGRPDKEALIKMLWRNECGRVLKRAGLSSPRGTPIINVWSRLMHLPIRFLCNAVRDELKARWFAQTRAATKTK